MAGRGPAPKDPARRARGNKDIIPTTVLAFEKASQPRLPSKMPGGEPWPARTKQWWQRWADDPRSDLFDSAAWDDLLDTAVIHGKFWTGAVNLAGELRLRVAKYGVTPDDRNRLRIQFAEADQADAKRPAGSSARERFGGLLALPNVSEAG